MKKIIFFKFKRRKKLFKIIKVLEKQNMFILLKNETEPQRNFGNLTKKKFLE